MTDLIKLLEQFNRKERFFLIGQALGNERFQLSKDFRERLGSKLGIKIPCDAFAWMDYHLDWVAASVTAFHRGSVDDPLPNPNEIVTGTQQDIDFLIAFREKEEEVHHLVFLEAKGYDSWSNDQMESKAERLEKIFGQHGTNHPRVKPYFCLMSRSRPQKLKAECWPSWMGQAGTPHWLKLWGPSDRRRVTRYDHDKGKPSKEGKFFKIVKA